MIDARKTAKDLVTKAYREDTPEKERVGAMVKAIQIIHDHNLLDSPFDAILGGNSHAKIRAAATIFEKLSDQDLVDSVKEIARDLRGVGESVGRARRRRR